MPVLLRNRTDIESTQRGKGVERCGFTAYGYQPLNERLPLVIDADYIRRQPGTLPSLRWVARRALLDTVKPDITGTRTTWDIMKTLAASPITDIGSVQPMRTDANRTTDYVIPLTTNAGHFIDVVVNGAWGVSWRLGADHTLVQAHPSLAVCQPEDTSIEPDMTIIQGKYYLSPTMLKKATRKYMDPEILAQRIRAYLSNLIARNEIKMKSLDISRGIDYFGENRSQALRLETGGQNIPRFGISFELGTGEGIKWVDAFGFSDKDKPHNLDNLSQEGREIGDLIKLFYHPLSFKQKRNTRT